MTQWGEYHGYSQEVQGLTEKKESGYNDLVTYVDAHASSDGLSDHLLP
jgi:hypothetical protein